MIIVDMLQGTALAHRKMQINRRMLPPYGDDPADQEWIQRGIDYANSGGKAGAICK
jgi:hypothetical protein